jgi:hypothetical protein
VNDADGLVSNFWRALRDDPAAVAYHGDWPVNENDLHARHAWLVERKDSLQARLEGDPDFYDAQAAGWWVWGMACWIGGGFCSGQGPWQAVVGDDGARQLVHLGNAGQGVNRKLVHLGDAGRGVNRQLVHLGDAGRGVNRKRVHLGNAGQGVNRQRVHLGNAGRGDAGAGECGLLAWMEALAARLARVRVCCGDWQRVCGPSPTVRLGMTAVFLDPPYSTAAKRDNDLYRVESASVAHDCREWAIEHGSDPMMRIALCGYESEHKFPRGWTEVPWKANGGYESQKRSRRGGGRSVNSHRERIWFSPHCLKIRSLSPTGTN